MGKQNVAFKPEVVKTIIETTGADEIAKTDLVKAIRRETGCASSRAYELVDEAQKEVSFSESEKPANTPGPNESSTKLSTRNSPWKPTWISTFHAPL